MSEVIEKGALFLSWVDFFEEKAPPVAFFVVETPDKKYPHGAIVNYETLEAWGIRIPPFPSYDRWILDRRAK